MILQYLYTLISTMIAHYHKYHINVLLPSNWKICIWQICKCMFYWGQFIASLTRHHFFTVWYQSYKTILEIAAGMALLISYDVKK